MPGIDVQFISDVSVVLAPGRTAVLAVIDENWAVPANTRLEALGGVVFRRMPSNIVEDHMARESAAFNEPRYNRDSEALVTGHWALDAIAKINPEFYGRR